VNRVLAFVWLMMVLVAGAYVAVRATEGLSLQTDLMALLPREARDPAVQRANDLVSKAVGRRVILLVGDQSRDVAVSGADRLEQALVRSGLMKTADERPSAEMIGRLIALYGAHRSGLLSAADRIRLQDGHADEIVTRALAQIYAPASPIDGRLLAADPFLLLPAFLADLPTSAGRLVPDGNRLVVSDRSGTWAFISGELLGEPLQLDFQDRFAAAYDAAVRDLQAVAPGASVRRLGALFYAHAGAREAMDEISIIGFVSMAAAVLLVILVFRAAWPLVLCVMAIGVGVLVALGATLLIFDQLHVVALLFGTTLIGAAVDYGLYYCAQSFSHRHMPRNRLGHVIAGLTLGLATSVVGYAAMALTPLSGLYQIAAFSVVGLTAAFLTVVLWFPWLDRLPPRRMSAMTTGLARLAWRFWMAPSLERARWAAAPLIVAVIVIGAWRMTVVDDVRRQQSLPRDLLAEQADVQRLTGLAGTPQFFLVQAPDRETALQREEALGDRLTGAIAAGDLAGWQAIARVVPSAKRQQENAALVRTRLIEPHLAEMRTTLGLAVPDESASGPVAAPQNFEPLTFEAVADTGAASLMANLIVSDRPGQVLHAVLLDGLVRADAVRSVARSLDGVRFIDPVDDLTNLFAQYRRQAMLLFALSVLFILPLIILRYGWRGGVMVTGAPVLAVGLTPFVLAAAGEELSFFSVIALVLVLSVGVDYAVFFAEEGEAPEPATMFAVLLAALTAVLSNGLLAWSRVQAVHAFGIAMLVGLVLAYVMAPLATRAKRRRQSAPSEAAS